MANQDTTVGDFDRIALERLGVRWTLHDRFDLNTLDDAASRAAWNQARLGEPVDDEHVNALVSELGRGTQLPPLIFYTDDQGRLVTLSGNHRRRAYELTNRREAPAYEAIGLKGLRAEDDRVLSLIYEANHGHGKAVSIDDRVEQAVTLIERGKTVRAAAASLGIPESRVRDYYESARATRRLEEDLGVSTEEIPISAQRRLANIKSDRVAREAARLVPRMARKTQEVNELVKAINLERSESAQLSVVRDYKAMLASQPARGETPSTTDLSPEVRRFDTAIGTLLRFDVEQLRSGIPVELRDRLVERVRGAQAKLDEASSIL